LLRELEAVRGRLPGDLAETPALPHDAAGLRVLAEDAWALALQALQAGHE
jgi:hypothetical protein